jgi:uncharacterized OB-fold protein
MQQWRRALSEGLILLQRVDGENGALVFPPRVTADDGEVQWVPSQGLGTVYSITIVRPRPPEAPYNVALIDLDEGVRMMSRVEGLPPEDVHIGMRVRAEIVQGEDPLLLFRPA